jgi:hypothetical protein
MHVPRPDRLRYPGPRAMGGQSPQDSGPIENGLVLLRALFFFGTGFAFAACAAACGGPADVKEASGAFSTGAGVGGAGVGGAGTGAAGTDGGSPACDYPWAAQMPSPNTLCYARRGVVACKEGSGSGMCLTEEPELGCQHPMEFDCQNQCEPFEHGYACSPTGSGPFQPVPPLGCRIVGNFSPGAGYYCCPCGS